MPKETIRPAVGPYEPKVGWAADRDVQVGVEVEGERSVFWTLLGSDQGQRELLGAEVRRIAAEASEQGTRPLGDSAIGEQLLDVLDTMTGSYRGVWATLDRQSCNALIRTLRRARDSAFGRDE